MCCVTHVIFSSWKQTWDTYTETCHSYAKYAPNVLTHEGTRGTSQRHAAATKPSVVHTLGMCFVHAMWLCRYYFCPCYTSLLRVTYVWKHMILSVKPATGTCPYGMTRHNVPRAWRYNMTLLHFVILSLQHVPSCHLVPEYNWEYILGVATLGTKLLRQPPRRFRCSALKCVHPKRCAQFTSWLAKNWKNYKQQIQNKADDHTKVLYLIYSCIWICNIKFWWFPDEQTSRNSISF